MLGICCWMKNASLFPGDFSLYHRGSPKAIKGQCETGSQMIRRVPESTSKLQWQKPEKCPQCTNSLKGHSSFIWVLPSSSKHFPNVPQTASVLRVKILSHEFEEGLCSNLQIHPRMPYWEDSIVALFFNHCFFWFLIISLSTFNASFCLLSQEYQIHIS